MMTRCIEWMRSTGGLFLWALVAGVAIAVLLSHGCDSGEQGCAGDYCEIPQEACGQQLQTCYLTPTGKGVCCSYNDGLGQDCTCSVCVTYRDELTAEQAYVAAMGKGETTEGIGGE